MPLDIWVRKRAGFVIINTVMVIPSLLRWWYGDGWLNQLTLIKWAFIRMADRFSIGLLIRTLFAPFRQISADEQARTAGGMMNVIVDKLISRLIGGVMRLVMIIVGAISLVLLAVISLIRIILWPLLPIAPVVGVVLMCVVGAPWKII